MEQPLKGPDSLPLHGEKKMAGPDEATETRDQPVVGPASQVMHGPEITGALEHDEKLPGTAGDFDPYYQWLGIPPKEQPPHFYRLLGIRLFEHDLNVIEAAADRQMLFLRTYQAGRHAALSQQLLNEVATAKLCLMDVTAPGLRGQAPGLRGQARDSGFKPRSFSIDAAFLATSRFDSAKCLPRCIRSDALSGWLNPDRPDNSRSVAVVQRRHISGATSRPIALLR